MNLLSWKFGPGANGKWQWNEIKGMLLQNIRDNLTQSDDRLKDLLTEARETNRILRQVRRNTAKKKRRRKP